MNGARKWHKATGPAFSPGEVWKGISGGFTVSIVSVRRIPGTLGDCTSDFLVTYKWLERGKEVIHEKCAWSFQVRYRHVADLHVSNSLHAEIRVAKAAVELRDKGSQLGPVNTLGLLVLGTPKEDPK